MFREAYAHATDGDLMDEAVNPRRLSAFAHDHRRGIGAGWIGPQGDGDWSRARARGQIS